MHSLIHPILTVRRDADGRRYPRLDGAGDDAAWPDGRVVAESFMLIEVSRHPNTAALDQVRCRLIEAGN